MKKTIAKIIAITVLAFGLASCASHGTEIDWNNARQIKAGMTQDEVKKLMGAPYSVTSRGEGKITWVWVHVNGWTMGSSSAALNFQDGKVIQAFDIPPEF